jgi:hypothetical protein
MHANFPVLPSFALPDEGDTKSPFPELIISGHHLFTGQ